MTTKRSSPYWMLRETWPLLAVSWLLCAIFSLLVWRQIDGAGTAIRGLASSNLIHLYPALDGELVQFALFNTHGDATAALRAVFNIQTIFLLAVSVIHFCTIVRGRRTLDLDSFKAAVLLPILVVIGVMFVGRLCTSACTFYDDTIDTRGFFVLRRTTETACASYMIVVAAGNLILWFGGHRQGES